MDVDAWPFFDRREDKEAASAAFQKASEEVLRLAGSVDGFLKLGSLDCGKAIKFLSDALGGLPSSDVVWLPEHVALLAGLAKWPPADEIPKSERWAYWSARKFLEVCVEHRMGLATS